MRSDSELLRLYVDEKSEVAFTALVQRHIALVHSVALRRVGGDTQLAEDVTQTVFTDLARKAATLRDRATLSGWLYLSAHHASAAVVRRETRRRQRETAAHTMQTVLAPAEPNPDWSHLRPLLDDAIVTLKDAEREAIALRFFEQRSFSEIGAALRLSEEAARKRVDRAIEKLRVMLARRGVTSTAVALAAGLTAIGSAPNPGPLAAQIASQALASASSGPATAGLGAALTTVFPAVVTLILGGALLATQRQTSGELRAELAALEATPRELAAVRAENRQLLAALGAADDLRRAAAEVPALRAKAAESVLPPAPRAVSARLSVNPDGTLAWERKPVNLREFMDLARALPAKADPESRVVLQGAGADFSALLWAIEELRKAGIEHVTIESDARPDPKMGWSWF